MLGRWGADFVSLALMLGKNNGRVRYMIYLRDFSGHSHGYFMVQYRIKKNCSIYDKIDGWQHNDKILD